MSEKEKWYPGKLIGRVTKKGLLKQELPITKELNEILDKAIKDESEAISFYTDAYGRVSEPIEVARLFRELALEEHKHRERLQEVKKLYKR